MNTPLISIIVPVYKVEQYLRKCVDSILAQTYSNIEVILVDDGSPDGCPAICDEYASKDTRVKVIHQANAGVSAARNAGLAAAKGEYIGFVDSDDWIEPDMYEVLLNMMSNVESSIAVSAICDEKKAEKIDREPCLHLSCNEAVKKLLFNQCNLVSVWGKLFDATILNDLRFSPEIAIGEDALFMLQAITSAKSVSYTHYESYHYLSNPESAMHVFKSSYWSIQNASDQIVDCVNEYDKDLTADSERRSIECDIALAILAADSSMFSKEAYERVMSHISRYNNQKSRRSLPVNFKCWYILLRCGRVPFIVGRKAWNALH